MKWLAHLAHMNSCTGLAQGENCQAVSRLARFGLSRRPSTPFVASYAGKMTVCPGRPSDLPCNLPKFDASRFEVGRPSLDTEHLPGSAPETSPQDPMSRLPHLSTPPCPRNQCFDGIGVLRGQDPRGADGFAWIILWQRKLCSHWQAVRDPRWPCARSSLYAA